MNFDCPNCHADIMVDDPIATIGDDVTCNSCGKVFVLSHDYVGDDYDIHFWLEAKDSEQ